MIECDKVTVTVNPFSKATEFKFVSSDNCSRVVYEFKFSQDQVKSLNKLTEDILNTMRGKSVKQFNRSLG